MRGGVFAHHGAELLSTSTTLLWACWKMKAMASASSRVLMVLSTAPLMGTSEVRLEHGRYIGGDDGDRVPAADAAAQGRGRAGGSAARSGAQLWRRVPRISAG